jgi:hypothetical protein
MAFQLIGGYKRFGLLGQWFCAEGEAFWFFTRYGIICQ